jgi:tRNA nucleotidyltransferase (CCA-adding enzyme)
MQIDINIAKKITNDEKEIFSIIKEVIEKYTPSTQAFAVGGWTRDKLLGVQSNDIDVMLSNISGEDFAKLLTNHIGAKEAHTIKGNPEKSKHITTSKAYIPLSSGAIQEVDFAQARSEVYNDNSRIPDIKPATPQEDAYRRDLTINSIFYNIITNKIEDFTGKGIKDLISNTIRTPLESTKTFSDDPLRVFRVIRFAAKYNGQIDEETYNAMKDPNIRNEIKSKVSKERIGQEFIKMLKNPNPDKSIQILKDTGLLEDIIMESVKGTIYEGKLAEFDIDQQNPNHKLSLWGHTMSVVSRVLEKYQDAEPEKRATMILAALMHDIGKTYKEIWTESKSHAGHRSYHGHEDESAKISELILKYLKIEPYIQQVSGLSQQHMRPHQLQREEGGDRALRRFIRQIGELSLNWLDVFNLAVSDAYSKDIIKDPNVVSEYQELERKLQEAVNSISSVSNKPEIKPILNGNEIMNILGIKPGPQMKSIMEFVKELKDENPNITKEEAEIKLKNKFQDNKQIKEACGKTEESKSICPKHLLDKKIEEVNNCFKEKRYYEVLTISNELKDKYGNDDDVVNILAKIVFKLLLKGEKYRYNNLIQYILDKAQLNFFDYVLCSYCAGILLLIETRTDDKIIREIVNRVSKMSPNHLKKVISMLPENVHRNSLKKEIEEVLN